MHQSALCYKGFDWPGARGSLPIRLWRLVRKIGNLLFMVAGVISQNSSASVSFAGLCSAWMTGGPHPGPSSIGWERGNERVVGATAVSPCLLLTRRRSSTLAKRRWSLRDVTPGASRCNREPSDSVLGKLTIRRWRGLGLSFSSLPRFEALAL